MDEKKRELLSRRRRISSKNFWVASLLLIFAGRVSEFFLFEPPIGSNDKSGLLLACWLRLRKLRESGLSRTDNPNNSAK